MKRLLEAALGYAALGWPILPLHTPLGSGCSCGRPCSSAGKHPRTLHGLSDATLDPALIHAWWHRYPTANVGIATGSHSGLAVLDIDPAHGGLQNLERLQRRLGPLPPTLAAVSGSGGLHLYFVYPAGSQLRNKVGLARRIGVDVRAEGGYIVATPSLHASGGTYSWLSKVPPAPLPDRWVWLLGARHQRWMQRAVTDLPATSDPERLLAGAVRHAQPGNRNDLGFWLACRLCERGLSLPEAEALMRRYAAAVAGESTGRYSQEEALASLRSAYRQPFGQR